MPSSPHGDYGLINIETRVPSNLRSFKIITRKEEDCAMPEIRGNIAW